MMPENRGGHKVLTSQHCIRSFIENKQNESSNQSMRQILANDIYLAISKYSDSYMLIINQTNTMGSIYKGKVTGEVLPQIGEEDYDAQGDAQQFGDQFQVEKIYQIKCLFGSTQIQFYELLVRKILQLLFQDSKMDPATNILVNISLPVKWKNWPEYQTHYYQEIIKGVKKILNQVF